MMRRKYWLWSRFKKWIHFILYHEKISAELLIEKRLQREYAKQHGIDLNLKHLRFHSEEQLCLEPDVWIGPESWIWCHANQDSGEVNGACKGSLTIKTHSYIGARFHADCYAPVTIGENCLIADDVLILTANHGMNPEKEGSYVKQPFETDEVTVEDGCWLGSRVTLLPGAFVGKKSIVGTNSVVTKRIPPYSIAVGSPARVVKRWNFDTHKWECVRQMT